MTRKYFPQIIMAIQMILDYLSVIIAFMCGYYFYSYVYPKWQMALTTENFQIYRDLALIAGFIFLIIFERFGLYSRKVGLLNVEEIKRIFQSLLIGSLILFSASFLLRPVIIFPDAAEETHINENNRIPEMYLQQSNESIQALSGRQQVYGDDVLYKPILGGRLYSRLVMLYSLIALLLIINIQRHLVNRILLKMHVKGPGLNRVLIYGAGNIGRQLQRRLFENPRIGMKPIGFIDDDLNKGGDEIQGIAGRSDTTIKVLGDGLQLPELVNEWDIHEIIIAMPNASTTRIYEIINTCIHNHVRFSFVPNLFDMFIQQVRFEEIEGIPLLRMKNIRRSYIYLLIKRVFDVLFATACLIVSLPFWPIITALIKIDSNGPILFKQKRIGKDGKLFTMYKFRSMFKESTQYDISPVSGKDQRITRVGRFLRRFSLDEIPQFLNVIKGDMSIVGPRPEMPFKVENYTPIQRQRLKVRPGITGIWQVSSARNSEIQENLDYDFYYTENQSFLLDIVIILKTIAAAIQGKGV
ncbi:sugar transferase [bacterium]|nr:sugar transferase [candidate division CSSED10-310 bacterium]